MSIYLLTADSSDDQVNTIETRLHEIIPEIRSIEKVDDIADEIRETPNRKSIVVYVSPQISTEGIENLIGISKRYHQQIFFILVSNEISATNYKSLVQSGGADWVAAHGPLQEIMEIIDKQATTSNKNAESHRPARSFVISFLPCMGGVGNTTIAVEVALQIKQSKETRSSSVCYVDLDFQTSHVCDLLDIEPRLHTDELFDRPERLDQQLLEHFVSRHSSGLDVFAAPRSKIDPCEINLEAMDVLLDLISRKYNFIILDLTVPWYRWTIPTIESSNVVVLTGVNTVVCLRQIRATLDAVVGAKTMSAQIGIAINRATKSVFGQIKRGKHVESVLNGEKIFYIHDDPTMIDRVNTGTPASVEGTGRYIKDFKSLAQFCAKSKQAA